MQENGVNCMPNFRTPDVNSNYTKYGCSTRIDLFLNGLYMPRFVSTWGELPKDKRSMLAKLLDYYLEYLRPENAKVA